MPSLFQKDYGYGLDLKRSAFSFAAMLFCAMLAELLGGIVSNYLLRRHRQVVPAATKIRTDAEVSLINLECR